MILYLAAEEAIVEKAVLHWKSTFGDLGFLEFYFQDSAPAFTDRFFLKSELAVVCVFATISKWHQVLLSGEAKGSRLLETPMLLILDGIHHLDTGATRT